ncbi:MAG: hypothetical protein WBB28_26520 [Crinalium sp.]
MIDWDKNKLKAFRLALQSVYREHEDLEIFAAEELGQKLADISERTSMDRVAFRLLEKSGADSVYAAFKAENPTHSVIAFLEQPLVPQILSLIPDTDWAALFEQFILDDLLDVRRAFFEGFQNARGYAFREARPDYLQLFPSVDLVQIRELLEVYSADTTGPILAVRFVEAAIAELRRSNKTGNRELTGLEAWRDRIAQEFNVPPLDIPEQDTMQQAYLLVTLEEHGKQIIAYPELQVTGQDKAVTFGAQPTDPCSVEGVINHILKWIDQAEAVLEASSCSDGQVTLEVFLPCKYLATDIAIDWSFKDLRGRDKFLVNHRRFLVRSTDRIRDQQIQRKLTQRWQRLETCIQSGDICNHFYRQETYPEEVGILSVLLENALGLKFLAQMPTDAVKREDLLYDFIDTAVPFALWYSEISITDTSTIEAEFDVLLNNCYLTDFAALSQEWRRRRIESPNAKPIRILCDRPDRLPQLPDLNREEDALVALP